jgi:hypothetical protein
MRKIKLRLNAKESTIYININSIDCFYVDHNTMSNIICVNGINYYVYEEPQEIEELIFNELKQQQNENN